MTNERRHYVTPEGQRALKDELSRLWSVERPEVTRKVSEAAALGDRSENAEYIYGKRQLRRIDARVRFLSKRLEQLVVVDRPPADRSRVYFGAWVLLEEDDGAAQRHRIVGADEFDPARGYVSVDAPLARALLGKSVGDEVRIRTPNGERLLLLREIHYDEA